MKTCIKCHVTKPLEGYYKQPRNRDGYFNKCIACIKIYNRDYRQAHPKYDRIHQPKPISQEAKKRYDTAHKAKHPDKFKARMTAYYARRKGILIRQPCEQCGALAEAHHEDYSKPLDVRWLCHKHHREAHRSSTV